MPELEILDLYLIRVNGTILCIWLLVIIEYLRIIYFKCSVVRAKNKNWCM